MSPRRHATLLSWPRATGAYPYLTNLARALADAGVATVSARHLAALVATPRGARWLHLHWPEWMVRDSSPVRAHVRSRWLLALLDIARRRGLRIAWTAHNLVGHDEPQPDLAVARRIELLSLCDVVFGHFPSAESDVRGLGFRGRFALTPHPGFPVDDSVPSRDVARSELGHPDDACVLLAYGAIEPYKGLDALAASFSRLASPRLRLHIAGEPRSDAALRALASIAHADSRIRIEPRHVDDAQTARLFAACDATVFTYRAFYTSGAAMLALSHGSPVIGAPVHHFETFAAKSFFVPLADASGLDVAVKRLAGLLPSARSDARAYAASLTWSEIATTIATTLFGAPEYA